MMNYGFSPTEELERRGNYVRQSVGEGFPTLAMAYNGGVVFVTKSTPIVEKISPVASGIGLACAGVYHHIRTVRRMLKNSTKKISMTNNRHVSVKELLEGDDSIIDVIGTAYGNIYGAPLEVDVVLAESTGNGADLYRVDFMGLPYEYEGFAVCGGVETEDGKGSKQRIGQYVQEAGPDFHAISLDDAVRLSIGALRDSIKPGDKLLNEYNREVLHIGILNPDSPLRRPSNEELERFYEFLRR